MELYRKVRLACRDGMSERAAARHFGVSRESVRKMLAFSVPPGYRRTAPVRRPKLGEAAKQRIHQAYRRVAAGGSQGGPSQAAAHREAHLRASSRRARLHRWVPDVGCEELPEAPLGALGGGEERRRRCVTSGWGGCAGPSAGMRSGNMDRECTPIVVVHKGRYVTYKSAVPSHTVGGIVVSPQWRWVCSLGVEP